MKITADRPNLRKIQAAERRLQLLDTALAVFAEKGFANATINDIAAAAGISSGLMYHYFPGKEKLLEAAVEHHSFLPQLREILGDKKGKQYREVLKNIAFGFIGLIERESMLVNIFLKEGSSNVKVQKVWSAMANEGISLLQEYLSAGISSGEFREHNTEITARCLFYALVMFHFTRDIFRASKVTRSQFVEIMIDNFIVGIQSKRG